MLCVCVCCLVYLTHVFFTLFLPTPIFLHEHAKVPSYDHNMPPEEALRHFQQDVPALGLLGTHHYIHPDTPYTVDKEVQLVCKYLKALKVGGEKGIDRLYQEGEKNEVCVHVF